MPSRGSFYSPVASKPRPGKDSLWKSRRSQPPTADVYILKFRPGVRRILAQIKAAIKESAPEAEERISYQMRVLL